LQDAGAIQNNPLTIALSELDEVYPGASRPQYLINLGTGTAGSTDEPQENRPERVFGDNFVFRLFRSYMSLLRGRKPWEDFRRSTKTSSARDRFFRLDVTLEGAGPKLDDVKAMPELKDMVRADKALSQAIDEISGRITASLFYFELEAIPEQRKGEFICVGHLLCLRRKSDPAMKALVNKLSSSSSRFIINGVRLRGDITDPSFWDGDGNFRKLISFSVGGEILISLREGAGREYPISGAPFSVDRLVAAQGLNAHFGTSYHQKRKRACADEGNETTKRRRSLRIRL
jgi:hypothetical protein